MAICFQSSKFYFIFEFFIFIIIIIIILADSILSLAGSQKYTMIQDIFYFHIFLSSPNPAKSTYG
jgi:hypothetical protein